MGIQETIKVTTEKMLRKGMDEELIANILDLDIKFVREIKGNM